MFVSVSVVVLFTVTVCFDWVDVYFVTHVGFGVLGPDEIKVLPVISSPV